jgi:phosphoribosylamine--glycine ligase
MSFTVLIIGAGGREHALAVKVAASPRVTRVLCAPGNAGTADLGENLAIEATDSAALLTAARQNAVDLTIVGPEVPLCAGIVDRFEGAGLRIFGPSAAAARIEGDKAYAKRLMKRCNVPTGEARIFDNFQNAKTYIATRDLPQVVKAAGLAAGKGVFVCDDPADALLAAERLMEEGICGDAGRRIVVEEKLEGPELSVIALVDGRTIYVLESAQDYKRLGDADTGPNTGGMGALSPPPTATADVLATIEREILVPIVDGLRSEGAPFRGALYAGVMLTAGGPKVLEFNCRFGDPETQVILPRLQSDIVEAIEAAIDERLDQIQLSWDPRPAVTVVMASAGYPGKYEKGKIISGLNAAAALSDVHVFHAGSKRIGDPVFTDGGRVLSITGLGATLAEARARAYAGVAAISFEGAQYRTDIADCRFSTSD